MSDLREQLHERVITVCDSCLNNEPGMCNEPACFFIRFTQDEIPSEFKLMSQDAKAHAASEVSEFIRELKEITDDGVKLHISTLCFCVDNGKECEHEKKMKRFNKRLDQALTDFNNKESE